MNKETCDLVKLLSKNLGLAIRAIEIVAKNPELGNMQQITGIIAEINESIRIANVWIKKEG